MMKSVLLNRSVNLWLSLASPMPFDWSKLRRELATMLRDGPMMCQEMADRVQNARGFTRRRARDTVDNILAKMKRAGRARLEGGLLGLATVDAVRSQDGQPPFVFSAGPPLGSRAPGPPER